MNRLAPVVVSLIALFILFAGVAYGQEDITPPSLLDVSFEPEVIDTSKGPVTITITVHITDDLSGLERAALRFRKPGTTQQNYVEFWSDIVPPVEGDALNGSHVATMILAQYSAFGEWEMFEVYLEDNVGNSSTFRKLEDEGQDLSEDYVWPSLYNNFNFEVGASGAPVEPEEPEAPARKMFIPLIDR